VHKGRRRTTPNSRHYKKGVSLQGLRRRYHQLRTFFKFSKDIKTTFCNSQLCIQGKEKNTLPQWTLQEVYVRERRPEEKKQSTQDFLSSQKTFNNILQFTNCVYKERRRTPSHSGHCKKYMSEKGGLRNNQPRAF
jgi:hypothetical protein